MNIPQMPSIIDLPIQELRNADVAFKVLEENSGEIFNPEGDGNCGYYVGFEAFAVLGKDRAGKKLYTYQPKYFIARQKQMELFKFGKKNVDHFVCHPDATVSPKLVQILPEGHSHIFGLNAPNLKTKRIGLMHLKRQLQNLSSQRSSTTRTRIL